MVEGKNLAGYKKEKVTEDEEDHRRGKKSRGMRGKKGRE